MNAFAISIRLLAGQYHATPWDRHVNEGAVEWPPSPWRILRALAAGAWRVWPDGPPPALTRAIDALGPTLPEYILPPATFAHTRHYMPITEGSRDKTTLVFDAFAVTNKGAEIVVCWRDVELDAEMRRVLGLAVDGVTYLGRAESWAEVTLVGDVVVGRPHAWPGAVNDEDVDTVTLLASDSTDSCWEALQVVTSELHAKRWNRAPGTRWVSYALALPPVQREEQQPPRRPAAAMLFGVWSRVPVKVEDTVVLAESIRRSVVKCSDDSRLHGHAEDGAPRTGHDHAFLIPYDDDKDLRIDHVLVYFRDDISSDLADRVSRAVAGWRDLTPWKNRQGEVSDGDRLQSEHPARSIRLTLLETWTRTELQQEEEHRKPAPLRRSKVWESRTPFVLTRHPKRHRNGRPKLDNAGEWRDGPWDQCQRELRNVGIQADVSDWVRRDAVQPKEGGRKIPWVRFRRKRRFGDGARFGSRGHGFRITFEEPVSGPLAIGYGSHFGLGLFMPELEQGASVDVQASGPSSWREEG